MDKKNIIEKISNILFSSEEEVKDEVVSLIDVTTTEGIDVRIKGEDLVEGVQVVVIDAEGNETGNADGVHQIEDKIVTIQDGIVTSIEDSMEEDEEEEVVVESKDEEVVIETVELDEDTVDPLIARVEKLEEIISKYESTLSKVNEELSLSKAKIEELEKAPAEKEVVLSKSTKPSKEHTMNEKMARLKELSKFRK